MYKQLKYILIILFLTAAVPAGAQSLGVETDPIRVSISSQTPAPGQTVTIEISGVGTFLGDASITWKKDGATVKSGLGESSYSFTAGQLGKLIAVQVTIDSPTQGTITRTFNFVPSTVNLMWEADTSVPPLYRGKALYTPGASVRIVAFPQVVVRGATLSANALSYQWKRGGETIPSQSGKGRNSFTFSGNQLKTTETINVDVYLDTELVGQGSIVIAATKPQIILYQRDPLRGVLWSEAMPAAVSLNAKEITLQAIPYFFSNDSLTNGDLGYEWRLNGNLTSGPDSEEGIMTLRQSGEGTGEALLSVSLQNTSGTKLLQSAQATMRMVFGGQSDGGFSSFFGL